MPPALMGNTADQVDLLVGGARYGDIEDVQSAMDQNISPDLADEQGRTGLHMASANGHLDVAEMLLKHGADVAAVNSEGNQPLHYACLNGQTQIVQLLLASGASAAFLNTHSRTPVDEALGRPHQDSILVLMDAHYSRPGTAQADVDLEDTNAVQEKGEDDFSMPKYDKYGTGGKT